MSDLSNCLRHGLRLFSLGIACTMFAQSSYHSSEQTSASTGVLKGELSLPSGLARPHLFILAYNTTYGGEVIPAKEYESTERFEVNLRPGLYYVVVHVSGYEPTCHVLRIEAGKVVEYNPKAGAPLQIDDYYGTTTEGPAYPVPLGRRPAQPSPPSNPQPR